MNRRGILRLTAVGLIVSCAASMALPTGSLAQSNPLVGTWKLNLSKSRYTSVPAPRSQTLTFAGSGQNFTNTSETVDAQGQTAKIVFVHTYDGMPHPTTGVPGGLYDATTYNRVDANTVNWVRSKDGKAVQTGFNLISADGKTFTVTTIGTGPNGQPINTVAAYEKQ
jgi:hypothetical protein